MSSALQSPARYYMTRYRSKAEEFCRALAARGLVRQAEWKPQTHIAANTFRTYIRPATATQEKRFIVAYQDWTPGSGVAKPPRLDDRTKRAPRRLCVNGCPRKNEDRAGECHACRSRRMYREDSTYREAKRARSRSWKARRNERMRVDPEYRARINSRRRELEARRVDRLASGTNGNGAPEGDLQPGRRLGRIAASIVPGASWRVSDGGPF